MRKLNDPVSDLAADGLPSTSGFVIVSSQVRLVWLRSEFGRYAK